MSLRDYSLTEDISRELRSGDLVLNLSSLQFRLPADCASVARSGDVLVASPTVEPIDRNHCQPTELLQLARDNGHRRFVVVTDAADAGILDLSSQLERSGAACLLIDRSAECSSDDFMDEEDREAVEERLRQLGYI
ncbi:MAG: hypothetical protein R3C19_11850 [Planctomycetaceae bacterium]